MSSTVQGTGEPRYVGCVNYFSAQDFVRRPAPELLKLERWPTVGAAALKPVARQAYQKRTRALDRAMLESCV